MTVELTRSRSATTIARPLRTAGSVLASLTILVVLWWLVTDGIGLVGADMFASPGSVADRLAELVTTPFAGETLTGHVSASLQRWVLGLAAAVLLGVPLGMLMAEQADVDAAVTPVFEALRFIPPLAWVPLAILWLGASVTAQALVVFVAAFPPCLLNAHRAVRGIDPVLRRAARTLGAGRWREVVWVAVPTGLPTVLAGVAIAMTNGWMALIGAELVGARSGLGFMILRGQSNAAPDIIVAAMVVIGIIGAAMTALMGLATRRVLRWQHTDTHRET
ncbi:ABC transporter permease [Jiangella asiatica]|uniref:ABC transporter permease n=1 Tax=Jiangella asiatica TaxID=2530372 RepID=A0A4R5CLV1_9ACTN|nr:ABC transporter permease [Jiangella asiatica]TDE00210.1 ABC transporter permease [Jiangella asiatica]